MKKGHAEACVSFLRVNMPFLKAVFQKKANDYSCVTETRVQSCSHSC